MDLDYCDIEWFALETNRDHSVIFEIAPKYCISDSSVEYEGYSIPSKGFLPTVVDIIIIWTELNSPILVHVHWFLKCQCSPCALPMAVCIGHLLPLWATRVSTCIDAAASRVCMVYQWMNACMISYSSSSVGAYSAVASLCGMPVFLLIQSS